ncbi:photosystem II stability/assembly factor-like uncharacterized protein [Plasticicumulans lactativorans]|uniref:Photosystem II stability/assembly factor-like uncharacterized protein n=1 Tax=Plasticicumulans lactativorans TaxID=1133106 RepID=A0A4R2L521_9GAMM|nr:YCF48-related protein [Plasticicumulans lactativorans]TCO81753.1 photosystem II stability/assembly factor-like uncharacterized protein [Plasticicumulans lactativorans]
MEPPAPATSATGLRRLASTRFWRSRQGLCFALGVLLLVLASVLALRQPPHPDAWRVVQAVTSLDWWRYPLERNAFRRLPAIPATLTGVHVADDGRVWIVTTDGEILHRSDAVGGWVRQWPPPPATPVRTPGLGLPAAQAQQVAPPRVPAGNALPEAGNAPPRQQPTPQQAVQQQAPQNIQQQIKQQVQTPAPPQEMNKAAAPPEPPPVPPTEPPPAPPTGVPALHAVFFLPDGRSGWAVGDGGTIVATADGGASWRAQASGTPVGLRSVHFVDARHGWAVGLEGTIVATADGGASWRAQTGGTPVGLRAVHFVDARRGWAVGGGGTIVATADGGASWRAQASGSAVALYAVGFTADGRYGWATGNGGTVVATADGGASWQAQASGTADWLLAVHVAADGRHVWAVGNGGTLIATTDGGATWRAQASGTPSDLLAVGFAADGRRGWAVGSGGTVLATEDGGARWLEQTSPDFHRAHAAADGRHVWVVGTRGSILTSADGGASWQPQASGTRAHLGAVRFLAGERRGWIVGAAGTLLASDDGGASWRAQASGTEHDLLALHLAADGRRGWAVGREGVIVASADGGASWQPQASGTTAALYDVHFAADDRRGWAAGDGGTLLATADGGASWRARASGTRADLGAVQFAADGLHGWVAGAEGTLLASDDGGVSWRAQASGTQVDLVAVHVDADGRHGWAMGEAGTILATDDGGASWRPQASGSARFLYWPAFADARRGWVPGVAGTLLATDDGGATWRGGELNADAALRDWPAYARYPAPWLYLCWAAGIGLLLVAGGRPAAEYAPAPSVADAPASDKPLEPGEADVLAFGALAQGLALFLRNEHTTPPLTLAITGNWGTGKSSLMNLLRGELGRYGVRAVWFNAWHHQKEEHLLAALVDGIRRQAVPPALSADGLRFRLRLMRIRSGRHWLGAALTLLLVSWAGAYFLHDFPQRFVRALDFARGLAPTYASGGVVDVLAALAGRIEGFAAFGAALAGLQGVMKAVRAFGVKPEALLASVTDKASVRELGAQTSFRYRFQQEFREVTQALAPRTMLILIDDLDRCQPAHVLEVLEAINFLVSSGDCYVVLGIDLEKVQASLGLAFRELAQELAEQSAPGATPAAAAVPVAAGGVLTRASGGASAEDEARAKRRRYASDYLKKLVNIEVPVPTLDRSRPEASRALLARAPGGDGAADAAGQARGERRLQWLRSGVRAVAWLTCLAGAATVGLWLAGHTPDLPLAPAPTATPAAGTVATPTAAPATAAAPGRSREVRSGGSVLGQSGAVPLLPVAGTAGGLLVLGLLMVLLRRPDIVVRDSPRFSEALDVWYRYLLHARRVSPRELKRYQNRVRYVAMRQRPPQTDPGGVERLLRALLHAPAPTPAAGSELPEPVLVALGAVQLVAPERLRNDGAGLADAAAVVAAIAAADPTEGGAYLDVVREHRTRFPDLPWPPGAEAVRRFLQLSEGVAIR